MSCPTLNSNDQPIPITNTEAFVGRASMLEFVRDCIMSQACVSLVGEPKSGLTSLLQYLMSAAFRQQAGLTDGELHFISIDCKAFDDPLPLTIYLLGELAPGRAAPSFPNWRPAFSRLISAVSTYGPRLVLVWDDFEQIGSNARFVQFIDSMRGLVHKADISLIVATHTELKSCCHIQVACSPFPNIFKVRYVGPLDDAETTAFLARKEATAGLTPFLDRVRALGGNWPYYLQLACQQYRQAQASLPICDPRTAEDAFLSAASPAFETIWQRLDEGERETLCALATNQPVAKEACVSLTRRGYVENGAIFSTALARFIRERANLSA